MMRTKQGVEKAVETRKVDLVFPKGNEEKLIEMAIRLGTTHLIMCYRLDDPLLRTRAKEVLMLAQPLCTTEFAILVVTQQDIAKAQHYTKTIIAISRPELFEDKRVSYIIDMESSARDDFVHHRNSGLNQVFIEHAKRTEKTLLVNAHNLLYPYKSPDAIVLGRIMQNNEFYAKYAPRVLVVSGAREAMEMRASRDLQILLDA